MRKRLYLISTAAAILAVTAAGDFVARADQPILLAATSADTVDTTDLVGRTVVDSKGTTLGKIDSVLVDAGGKVKHVVVGVGGFLGIGEKDVALRWDQLSSQSGDKLVAGLTKEQLTSMPGYKYSDAKRRGTVYSYDEGLTANPYLADNVATQTTPPSVGATVDTTNLVGRTVVDSKGDTLGKIDSVLVDSGGKVKYVILGVGGFLGIGEKDIALRWDQLNTRNGDKLVADLTKEQLTSMPRYKYADTKRRGTVYPYSEELAANPYLADSQPTVTASTNANAETPPFPGANSFTETQARSRIEDHGFTAVSDLRKDDQGIWRGTAMKDGKSVSVALDYKGNIVAQ
jgi:sporulation protein YlmC with PRC-barrel domain